MNQKPADTADELSWSAFRFIAGEMSADESLSFEERLATDQSAREAVAEAVELFHAVCAAEAAEPVVCVAAKQRSTWSQRFTWVASGAAAAAIVVAVGLNLSTVGSWFTGRNEQTIAKVSPALADAWSLVRSEDSGSDEVGVSRSTPTDDDMTEEELASFTDEQLTLATETPSWMTAGVLGLSTRDGGTSAPQEN